MKGDQYQAIACSQYDVYEIAIMRRQMLKLSWIDESGSHFQHLVKPLALNTRNGEEFLTVSVQTVSVQDRPGMESIEIRLDRIVSVKIAEGF